MLALTLGGLLSGVHPGRAQQAEARITPVAGPHAAGWLGIRLDGHPVPPGTPGSIAGVRIVVTDLYTGGPAETGGLRRGDVLLRINGAPADLLRFRSLAGRLAPGDPLALTVLREGRPLDLAITLGRAPDRATLVPLEAQVMQLQLDSVRTAFVERLASVRTHALAEEARAMLATVPEIQMARTAGGDSLTTVVVLTRPDGSVVRLQGAGGAGTNTFTYHLRAAADSVQVDVRATGRGELLRMSPSRAPEAQAGARGRAEWRPLTPYLVGANRVAGAALREVDEALGRYFGAERGLLVTDVAEGSPARGAGMQPGDLVLGVHGREVTSIAELRHALGEARGLVAIRVLRRGRVLDLTLPR